MTKDRENLGFTELYRVVKQLRAPGGCPWDRKQSPESLKKYLLEETRELAEAIDAGGIEHIREELGDLFFILMLLSRLYEEEDHFATSDVLREISEKMVRRHPHVFSDAETGTDRELKQQWEAIKKAEKKSKGG